VSVVASVQTGHYFAMPFALLFTIGYAYVAVLLVREQAARRRAIAAVPALADGSAITAPVTVSEPPPSSGEQWAPTAQGLASATSGSDMAA
jgi:hypothetical protein